MRLLGLICLFVTVIFATTASAECSLPPAKDFATQATALFNCPSALPLKGGEGKRKFQVHYDFPKTVPDPGRLPWLAVDPLTNPTGYMHAILEYATKYNGRPDIDWRIEDNKEQHWCNAPWLQDSREPLHGMTTERWSRPKELNEKQVAWAKNWAVGIYNDLACYGLGQIWSDPTFPKTKGFSLPEGALGIKLLFTNATPAQVPFLSNSKEWEVAAGNDGSIITMRMLQVDVSVKDKRSPNGWFFGTFMYDGTKPGKTPYDRLVPVGLMWGSDPDLLAGAYYEKAAVPKESWVNPEEAQRFYALPRQHLGLFGRTNGPVDNPKSACITCHQRAMDWGRAVLANSPEASQAAKLLPDVPSDPFIDSDAKAYFRNIGTESPVPNTQTLDYSLQVAKGISIFRAWVLLNYPDHAGSTTNIPPYPFSGLMAGSQRSPTAGAAFDEFNR